VSGGEVSIAAACGLGAAWTVSAAVNEPIAEWPMEMDAPLGRGLVAYTIRAAIAPRAKMMVSTCSNTISIHLTTSS